MRRAYDGRWYTTLTFVQRTSRKDAQGRDTVETWFESLRHTPAEGPSCASTGEPPPTGTVCCTRRATRAPSAPVPSSPTVRGATPSCRSSRACTSSRSRRPSRSSYPAGWTGPAPSSRDAGRSDRCGSWERDPATTPGRRRFGWTSSGRSWSAPCWSRSLERPSWTSVLGASSPSAEDGSAPAASSSSTGKLDQLEEYEDWKAGVDLSPALFDPATFATAKHWAAGARTGKDGG